MNKPPGAAEILASSSTPGAGASLTPTRKSARKLVIVTANTKSHYQPTAFLEEGRSPTRCGSESAGLRG